MQRHPEANAQAMTQRASAGFNTWNLTRIRMPTEHAIRSANTIQFRFREEPLICEHSIKSKATVALAQNAPITTTPLWVTCVDAQYVVVQNTEYIDHRKRRADVPPTRPAQHTDDQMAKVSRAVVELR
jgi:hypothetical protein